MSEETKPKVERVDLATKGSKIAAIAGRCG